MSPRLALRGALVGIVVIAIAFLPRYASALSVDRFTRVAIFFVAILGLQVLVGYSGQISLGHWAFAGIGGYVTAMVSLGRPGLAFANVQPPGWLPVGNGMHTVWTIPLAGLVAGIAGYLFGIPALRLAGVSLALATFAVAVSLPQVAKRFENVTGGGGGLNLNLPETPFGWDISVPHWLYYQAWVCAAALAVLAWLLLRGRAGRALGALRDGEVAAISYGVNPVTYKTFAFGLSSAYAGVAGALLAIQSAYVNPDSYPVDYSIRLLASLVLGGIVSMYGALFGGLIMVYLPIWAQDPPLTSSGLAKEAPGVVFGVLLIVIMFLAPSGVAGLLRDLGRRMIDTLKRTRSDIGGRAALGRSRRAEL
jgi:branched-chain amino acid transport system permease protein